MLRNAIVHIANEQPLMADLVVEPSPSDVCLLCTNIRTMNGTKPVFVDYLDSTFLLPLNQIRFIEIPARAYAQAGEEARAGGEAAHAKASAGSAAPVSIVRGNVIPLSAGERPHELPDPATGQDVPQEHVRTVELRGSNGAETEVIDDGLDSELLRRIREI